MRWKCNCGDVELAVEPGDGTRLVCYCTSCQDCANRFGGGDSLDAAGGTDLFQTAPETVKIVKGQSNLSWIKLTPKGPHRWHTTCCDTPMANTLGTRAIPFTTVLAHNIDDKASLGPIVARVNRASATQNIDGEHGSMGKVIRPLLWRMLRSRLSGRYKQSPFFASDGTLIAKGVTVHD